MKNELIKHLLDHCFTDVVAKLSDKNWEHFRDYFFIQSNYKTNFDDKFRDKFSHYYGLRMDAREKDIFFNLLDNGEDDLEKTIETLYDTDRHRLYLSFASKLLHTLNYSLPIYDNNIAFILGLPEQNNKGSLETKLQNRKNIYKELNNKFEALFSDSEAKSILGGYRQEIDKQLNAAGIVGSETLLTERKLLDSLLWSLYFVLAK